MQNPPVIVAGSLYMAYTGTTYDGWQDSSINELHGESEACLTRDTYQTNCIKSLHLSNIGYYRGTNKLQIRQKGHALCFLIGVAGSFLRLYRLLRHGFPAPPLHRSLLSPVPVPPLLSHPWVYFVFLVINLARRGEGGSRLACIHQFQQNGHQPVMVTIPRYGHALAKSVRFACCIASSRIPDWPQCTSGKTHSQDIHGGNVEKKSTAERTVSKRYSFP